MKRIYLFLLAVLMLGLSGAQADESIITKDLKAVLKQKSDNELIRVNIRLKEQLNQMTRYTQLQNMKAEARRATVVNELKSFHKQSQSDLMGFLNSKPSSSFKLVRQLWIANVVTALVDEATIYELSQRSDIDRIDIDEERQLVEAMELTPFVPGDKGVDEITYNVLKVNADDVWGLGYTGEGVIVSVIDAGINYNHVDLADHMWEDDEYPLHGYDFHNNDNDPMDGHGHGTHCAGTVAGDGTAGSQTGMAPDATLMGCKVLGDDGSGEESNVWAAIEFSVEQGAHIISMSLGWQHSWNPDRQTWRLTYDNTLAAGVIASVAAGNEGGSVNNPDDVRTPGDCPPPWLHPEQTLEGGISAVFCVGATDASDNIAYFSSRGPSDWSTIDPFFDYPFNPEMGLLRPDVSAPGVDVKSCNAFNPNGYTSMSGTSMATPGVAGVMALMLSKNPGLSPAEIAEILETTSVDLGDTGKDNVFGSGRIDAFVAVNTTSEQGPVYEEHVFVDPNSNGQLEAGESVLMNMTMYNGSDMDYSNVDVTVTSTSSYISFTDSTENYGDFATQEAISIDEAFAFDVADDLPGQQNIRFNVLATDGIEIWESRFDVVSWGPNIYIGNMMIDDAAGNNNGRLDPGEEATILIEVLNDGQADLADVNLSLDYNGEYINFATTSFDIVNLASEQMEYASFDVVVSEEANVGQADLFTAHLSGGVFSDTKDFVMVIGLIVEDWETGDFTSFEWGFDGSDWFITDQDPYEGLYCVQSADISDNQQTSLEIDYEVGTAGTISFYKKVSSENSYDYLRFYIDGVEKGSWSGEVDWSFEEYEVTEGLHTFKWQYDKDAIVSSGADAAWVDHVVFPPMMLPSVTIADEAEICADEQYMANAIVENAESFMWSTSGDGSFGDEQSLTAIYTLGEEDIENQFVELILTASSANGDVHASTDLYINPVDIMAPSMPMGEMSFCVNPEDQYYSTEPNEYELEWMLSPAEAGELTQMADSVLVNWNDEYTGVAELSVKAMGVCGESNYSEPLQISIFELPQLSFEEEMIESCPGEVSINAELTGMAPFTLNIDGLGEYEVETNEMMLTMMLHIDTTISVLSVSDAHACVSEETVQLEVYAHEVPVVSLNDTSVCMNHVVEFDAGNPGAEYFWMNEETSQTILVDSMGMDANNQKEVMVNVTNEFGCSSSAMAYVTFEDCSGINEIGLNSWSIFPNPSQGYVELEISSEKVQTIHIDILSLNGQMLYSEEVAVKTGSQNHQLDLSNLAPQTYLVVLRNNSQQVIKRLIIE
jgi:subtilisin family serine protease